VFWFSVSVFLTYKTHGRWNLRTRVVSVGGTPRKRKLLAMFGVVRNFGVVWHGQEVWYHKQ